jgi:hypothetical protein
MEQKYMRDSDVTGAAVQVRLEGHLFAELENWRRAQPKIIPRSWALRQLVERALADDRRSGEGREPLSPDNNKYKHKKMATPKAAKLKSVDHERDTRSRT